MSGVQEPYLPDGPSKPWYQSRLIWANLLTALVAVVTALTGTDLLRDYPQAVAYCVTAISLLNIFLRAITRTELTPTRVPGQWTNCWLVLLLPLWLGTELWAEMPKAVITGPKESLSGNVVTLDGRQSTGSKYLWKILEEDRGFFEDSSGMKIGFSAGVLTPTTFHFILVVAGTNANGGPEVDITAHDLLVMPMFPVTPPPGPVIPVNPPQPPSGKATGVVLLVETEDLTQPQRQWQTELRNDPELSKLVRVLDRNAQQESGQPVPLVTALVEFVGNQPLPRLVAVNSAGPVFSVDVPPTIPQLRSLLQSWGLL